MEQVSFPRGVLMVTLPWGSAACREAAWGMAEVEGSVQSAGKASREDTAQRAGLCCPALTFFSEYWNISMASSTWPSS